MWITRFLGQQLVRIHRFVHELEHEYASQELKKRCKAFGQKSRIGWPFRFNNPEFIEIGSHVQIAPHSRIEAISSYVFSKQSFTPALKIDDGVSIEMYCHVSANNNVHIGANSMLAGRVYISDHGHTFNRQDVSVAHNPLSEKMEVVIGEYCFIGEGASILPGVHLGHHSVVGANAVVTNDFPPYSVIAGVPARLIKSVPA